VASDRDLIDRLAAAGQGHLAEVLAALRPEDAASLAGQLAELDLDLVSRLVAQFVGKEDLARALGDLTPPDTIPLPGDEGDEARDQAARAVGDAALRDGRVGLVLLAGGQGTRLGFDGPKGNFPFGPVRGTTLFAHHAAKVAALRVRHGAALPWCILTSPANDAATRAAFADAGWFGLDPESVRFVVQGTLPAVDAHTGAMLRDAPGRLALSPDGHGGVFLALRRSGALDWLAELGATTVFTFQVDNPLTSIADPGFLGYHLAAGADMSNLAVRKRDPGERVGVIARRDGHTVVVEYSDLDETAASARAADGGLVLWAGNVATHLIEIGFARRLTDGGLQLPYHRALKKVPYIDDDGRLVQPDAPNAFKFETFIFDALPMASAPITVEIARDEQFSPIKNATGGDSPETCRRDMNRLYALWLAGAGVSVARAPDGEPVDLEIDPRCALDAADARERLVGHPPIDAPTYLPAP
jgi:UDP-N-acetylglucosamine/UDP-N-acetylgalactosamine diphosphorylase